MVTMQDFNWNKLQNGSDLRGVALEGVPNEQVNLTPEIAKKLLLHKTNMQPHEILTNREFEIFFPAHFRFEQNFDRFRIRQTRKLCV